MIWTKTCGVREMEHVLVLEAAPIVTDCGCAMQLWVGTNVQYASIHFGFTLDCNYYEFGSEVYAPLAGVKLIYLHCIDDVGLRVMQGSYCQKCLSMRLLLKDIYIYSPQ